MTNHIEQLMKAAGVGYIIECKHGDEFPENCDCNYPCEECSACIKKYPAFTLEKQLELIKFLFKAIPTKLNPYFKPVENTDKWQYIHTDLCFEEALAEMVWNALPVLDKSEVKRILED